MSAQLPRLEEFDRELTLRRLETFIPAMTPSYAPPVHLRPLLECFEAALRGEPQRVVCHAPPRHAKTESVLRVPAFGLRRNPALRFSYSTYGDRLSRSKSRTARRIAEDCGITLTSTALNEWRTPEGGGLLAGGVGGPLTGHGVDILIVDDPIKNRIEAESATYRERLMDWWRDVAATRIEPGGSAFIFATRWHPDDLSGQLIAEGFKSIVLPALDDAGNALWPSRWSPEALERRRVEVGEYTWASLYQGQPRARGGRVFGDVATFDTKPTEYRAAFGLDLAYSVRSSSDYSVAVKMLRKGDLFYVVDVLRRQETPPRFKALCMAMRTGAFDATPWRWYASGTEAGAVSLFHEAPRLPVQAMTPKGDKFVRAIEYAAAWNAGRVLLPKDAPWLDAFIAEHAGFTGINDAHDDQVDAAVAAFDQLSGQSVDVPTSLPDAPAPMGLRALGL